MAKVPSHVTEVPSLYGTPALKKELSVPANQNWRISSSPSPRLIPEDRSLPSNVLKSISQLKSQIDQVRFQIEERDAILYQLDIQQGENEHSIRDQKDTIEKLIFLTERNELTVKKSQYLRRIQQYQNNIDELNLENSKLQEKIVPLKEELVPLKKELEHLEVKLALMESEYFPYSRSTIK